MTDTVPEPDDYYYRHSGGPWAEVEPVQCRECDKWLDPEDMNEDGICVVCEEDDE